MNTGNAVTPMRPVTANPLADFVDGRNKDRDCRLKLYLGWQTATGRSWLSPDLADYRDYLLEDRQPSTTAAYLATIRATYGRVLDDNHARDMLLASVPTHDQDGQPLSIADRLAMLAEVETRLRNQVKPTAAPVTVTTKQDRTAGENLRLTSAQCEQLVSLPGQATTKGIRDTAILAVLLSTGIREGELCGLDVDDLRQKTEDGELAIRVRHGKGDKQRLIPYGDMNWCLVVVDAWLAHIGRTTGPVFTGLYKQDTSGNAQPRPGRLTTRSVIRIVKAYPVSIEGKARAVKPHDCRRSYARLMWEKGAPVEIIQQNLGHANRKTTLLYIGSFDGKARRTRALFTVDLSGITTPRWLDLNQGVEHGA